MNACMMTLARHNVAGIYAIGRYLESRGGEFGEGVTSREVAGTVLALIDTVAWADRRLHRSESQVVDAVLEEDAMRGGALNAMMGKTRAEGEPAEGAALFMNAVVRHDAERGTCLGPILYNHFENLGNVLVAADAEIAPSEVEALQEYLRSVCGALNPQPLAGAGGRMALA